MNLDDFDFSTEDILAAQEKQNPYLADAGKGLSLVLQLIASASPSLPSKQQQRLVQLHRLVQQRFWDAISKDDFPGKTAAWRDLQAAASSLEDRMAFPYLADKVIVGVGGGFGAGKSRFLNTLCGIDLLPESLEPTTAIPTYLTKGKTEAIIAWSIFNQATELDVSALNAISHAFRQHYQQALGEDVGFAHMLRLLMIKHPRFTWPKLALLDTPGYSKADANASYSDAETARNQLAEADYLVWLVNAKNGSIRQDDIDFLKSLNHSQAVFVVITQADLLPSTRVSAVVDATREALQKGGVAVAGLMAWEAPMHAHVGRCIQGDDIRKWLEGLNQIKKDTGNLEECKQVLDAYIHHHQQRLAEGVSHLQFWQQMLVFSEDVVIRKDVTVAESESIQLMIKNLKDKNNRQKKQIAVFTDIKNDLLNILRSM